MAAPRVFRDERKVTYLNVAAADRPLTSPVSEATLAAARRHRLARIRGQLDALDCAAILLYDPVNIRYALDVSNMALWMAHNPTNYALILAAVRPSTSATRGRSTSPRASRAWTRCGARRRTCSRTCPAAWRRPRAGPPRSPTLVRAAGGTRARLAIDVCDPAGLQALQALDVQLVEGRELTENARMLKSADELALMRWTIKVCDAAIQRMYEVSAEPGRTELEIWAELHHENIRNGGEWIETRLLTSGPRTNPWFQEASHRVTEAGDLLAFDTDMIGPYGYCADLSRSWTIGHTPPTPHQRDLYLHAREQIEHNMALLRDGLSLREFNERQWPVPERFIAREYGWAFHGVGMADEYPCSPTPSSFAGSAYDQADLRLEAGMVVCLESLVGEEQRGECVKLEAQVAITRDGYERLDAFPWEDWD